MIVRFVIDPSGIGFPSHEPALRRSITINLLSVWRCAGLLFTGDKEWLDSPLAKAIDGLPPDLKLLWKTAIAYAAKNSLMRRGPDKWPGQFGRDGVVELGSLRGVDVALIEKEYAGVLGVLDGEFSHLINDINLEICRLDCVAHARAFEDATNRKEGEYEAGTAITTIWNTLFDPLVRKFQRIY